MQLVKDHPIIAMRSCFHYPSGDTNTGKAAEFFGVSQRTIQHWVQNEAMPQWAVNMLIIHYCGYLPHNDHWDAFTNKSKIKSVH